mmetsp:Transcript_18990/g.33420  ORF Transcript_18990/g.33420 Transcript_18990/m.33420 type:complete len:320 (-) Transcript_18990:287-1246(-)
MKFTALPSSLAALAFLQGALLPTNAFHAPANTSLQHPKLTHSASSAVTHQNNHHRGALATISQVKTTSTALPISTASSNEDPYSSPQLDTDALTKYAVAAITELTLFSATFQLLDLALAQLDTQLPLPAVAFLFYGASLKSRAFNPLNNQRPDRAKAVEGEGSKGFGDRVMPSWTPPGVIFPIMWVLIIGPIRAYSAALVVSSTGSFFCLPIMAFMLHLTIGDVWNTINNTEKRYGAAVIGVLCVVISAANAGYQYSTVDPLAGQLLGGTCLWLVTAAALITDTWRLNPAENGEKVPLYPVKGEAETSFMWFNKGEGEE